MGERRYVEEQLGALEYELNSERAAVLGRTGRDAEAAIARCQALFERLDPADVVAVEAYRAQRRAAQDAVDKLCLQLEMLGVYDQSKIHRFYPVPPAVPALAG